jgi:hypothetical protein
MGVMLLRLKVKGKELSIRLKTMIRGTVEEKKSGKDVNICDLVLVKNKNSTSRFGSFVPL